MAPLSEAHTKALARICIGLGDADSARVADVLTYVMELYAGKTIITGQTAQDFSLGVATTLSDLHTDVDSRIAGLLFEMTTNDPKAAEVIEARYGKEVAELVVGVRKLVKLRELTFVKQDLGKSRNAEQQAVAQIETLRKMLLAMASDMRVVLVRLASRVTSLRFFAEQKLQNAMTIQFARETMDLYAPLANRLGIGQLKWEMEDLSFRFLEPEAYKTIAKQLEEKRMEREGFVGYAISRLKKELDAVGVTAEVSGRPKHIYSIWNKMRGKKVGFEEIYDVRAFRVIVDDEKACYTVLGILNNIWTSIPKEFDDYISRPKPNGYRSLHTVVVPEDGKAMEVQIRTREMHQSSEFGVAAHWRYKERNSGATTGQDYNEKIAWLRQLLAWKSEVVDAVAVPDDRREWVEQLKATTLDDHIFAMTPQARVLELPQGATPIDFAYHLHTDVGHRCRGAKVDGVMAPLNTHLKNGQTVEIITAKGVTAGPSRDWLSDTYSASPRTRAKIRAWFHAIDQEETLMHGRSMVEKTLQREGKTAVNLEDLARLLGFAKLEDLFLAVGKDEYSLRNIEHALHPEPAPEVDEQEAVVNKSRASSVEHGAKSGVLVVGTEGLMTQLAKCCKPAPPDKIAGFVTRGKGVSIHRANCKNFAEMRMNSPERVIDTDWGAAGSDTVYPVDIFVLAGDRQGLLRDISEIFSREKINVIGVNTQSAKGQAQMSFTAELSSTAQLQKALTVIRDVRGVLEARRK